ncbi:MAG: hypothetical protein ABF706_10575 [Novacetimonas hansenii]
MLTRGDVVVRGNARGIVVTVAETRVLVVPIVWGTARLHRADVVPIAWEATSLRAAIIHCGQWAWVDISQQKRVGQVCVETMRAVRAAMRREAEARQTERLVGRYLPRAADRIPAVDPQSVQDRQPRTAAAAHPLHRDRCTATAPDSRLRQIHFRPGRHGDQ